MGQVLPIGGQSAQVLILPIKHVRNTGVIAQKVAALVLVDESLSQVEACRMAGMKQPLSNASRLFKSVSFHNAYARAQEKLQIALPVEIQAAADMYREAYDTADCSQAKIRAVDSLCRLYGLGGFAKKSSINIEVAGPINKDQLADMPDAALLRLIEGKG